MTNDGQLPILAKPSCMDNLYYIMACPMFPALIENYWETWRRSGVPSDHPLWQCVGERRSACNGWLAFR